MPQYMRPTGSPTAVGWTGSAADVADSGGVNDGTFIESPLSPTSTSYWDCALSGVTDPHTDEGLVLRFRHAASAVGGDAKQVTVLLYRASDGAPVVSQTVAVTAGVSEVAIPLSAAQAAVIAAFDAGALRVRVIGQAASMIPSGTLAPAAFTYAGSFKLPTSLADAGYGLAYNPVSHTLYSAHAGLTGLAYQRVVEYSIPTPVVSATRNHLDLPRATEVRPLTDPTGGLLAAWQTATGKQALLRGLTVAYVPNQGYKLFWSFYPWFNFTTQQLTGIGCCDLDFSNPRGIWGLSTAGSAGSHISNAKWAGKRLIQVPQAWADTYLGGRSLLAGAFIQQNIAASSGGVSFFASAPWSGSWPINGTWMPATTLADYPAYGGPSTGDRMLFPPDYPTAFKPAGYQYQWESDTFDGGAYVSTPSAHAIVTVCRSTGGASWYDGGTEDDGALSDGGVALAGASGQLEPLPGRYYVPWKNAYYTWATGEGHYPPQTAPMLSYARFKGHNAGRQDPVLLLHDPADLAAVAAGTKTAASVRPYGYVNVAGALTAGGGSYIVPNSICHLGGAAYDSDGQTLYVLQNSAYQTGSWGALVHVFQVT